MQNTQVLFYDTETTGLPVWNEPSGSENQPHIVELAAKLIDLESREVIGSFDSIIYPEGWVIPQETIEIHGISMDQAICNGMPEGVALNSFMSLWRQSDFRVAHNESFDARIMRIAIKRFLNDEVADQWKEGKKECTGLITKPIMQMLPKNKFGFKMPTLSEAYEHFTGKPMQNAHRAMADVDACIEVYFAVLDQQSAT